MNPPWMVILDDSPEPLRDVLVSAWDASEREGVVFMAWRSANDPDRWVLSGSDEPLVLPVYAWCPVVEPCRELPDELLKPRGEPCGGTP